MAFQASSQGPAALSSFRRGRDPCSTAIRLATFLTKPSHSSQDQPPVISVASRSVCPAPAPPLLSPPTAPQLSLLLSPRPPYCASSVPQLLHMLFPPPGRLSSTAHLADSCTSRLHWPSRHFLRASRVPFRSLVLEALAPCALSSWHGFPCPRRVCAFLGMIFVYCPHPTRLQM